LAKASVLFWCLLAAITAMNKVDCELLSNTDQLALLQETSFYKKALSFCKINQMEVSTNEESKTDSGTEQPETLLT